MEVVTEVGSQENKKEFAKLALFVKFRFYFSKKLLEHRIRGCEKAALHQVQELLQK